VKPTVTVVKWLLQASLFALQNSFTENTLDTGRVFDELLDRQLVRLGDELEHSRDPQSYPARDLLFNELKNLLFHTYLGSSMFM
jgi:hypothetical protein